MKTLNLDKPMRYLYFATIAILLTGLGFAVLAPVLQNGSARQANSAVQPTKAPADQDPILVFKQERELIRERERQELKSIMDDERAEQSLKTEAGQRLMQLLGFIEAETTIEGVLRIRGFSDPVVTVHQDSANVMLRADALTRAQSAQVLELVNRETGLGGGNIKIMPIN